jgi:hypothetical protein
MYKIYAYLLREIVLIFKSQIDINFNIMYIILSLKQLLMALGHLHKDVQAGHLWAISQVNSGLDIIGAGPKEVNCTLKI